MLAQQSGYDVNSASDGAFLAFPTYASFGNGCRSTEIFKSSHRVQFTYVVIVAVTFGAHIRAEKSSSARAKKDVQTSMSKKTCPCYSG